MTSNELVVATLRYSRDLQYTDDLEQVFRTLDRLVSPLGSVFVDEDIWKLKQAADIVNQVWYDHKETLDGKFKELINSTVA